MGIVARMIGTAPRRPAHDRNTWCRHGVRNQTVLTNTASGRATRVRNRPMTTPCSTGTQVRRSGLASSPSMTNRPIWQIHPTPSANNSVACW